MTDQDRLSEGASNVSYTTSNRHSDFVPWGEVEEIQILHKASLQDLLEAKNAAVQLLLKERNTLLREWYGHFLSHS
jgi:hypothetical protein